MDHGSISRKISKKPLPRSAGDGVGNGAASAARNSVGGASEADSRSPMTNVIVATVRSPVRSVSSVPMSHNQATSASSICGSKTSIKLSAADANHGAMAAGTVAASRQAESCAASPLLGTNAASASSSSACNGSAAASSDPDSQPKSTSPSKPLHRVKSKDRIASDSSGMPGKGFENKKAKMDIECENVQNVRLTVSWVLLVGVVKIHFISNKPVFTGLRLIEMSWRFDLASPVYFAALHKLAI